MRNYRVLLIMVLLCIAAVALIIFFQKRFAREGGVVLNVINQSRWAGTIEQAVAEWNRENPDSPVVLKQLVIGYSQLRNKLITSCGAGHPPDISILDGVWLAEFSQRGHLAPLDEIDSSWYVNDYKADFFKVFQKGDTYDGHLWGIRTQTDMALLWYRKDWLAAEGLSAPQTWDDLIETSKYFQKSDVREIYGNSAFPLALPLGQKARETLVYQLLPLFWSNSGEILHEGELVLDSQNNVETLTFLKKLVHTYKVVSPEAVSFEWDQAMRLLATGKAAMAFGGSYEKRMIQEVSGWDESEFLQHVGYTLIPAGPQGEHSTTAGGMCYVVYQGSINKKLALDIVKRATSLTIMEDFLLETSQHPPRISIANRLNDKKNPFLAETAQYLYHAKTRPNFPEYSRMSDILQEMVENAIQEDADPAACISGTSQKITKLMESD
jgi:multiple sugar transport system substrate-binding protein